MKNKILKKFLESVIVEKTLYHGTVIDNKEDIEQFGLLPQLGDWVKDAYSIEYDFDSDEDVYDPNYEDPEEYWSVVFAGDKEGLGKAVGGIKFHIGKKLGKYITDVSWQDIKNHGMLAIIDSEDADFQKHDPNEYYDDSVPPSVETDDYWTRNSVPVKKILTGNSLIKYLNKFGIIRKDYSTFSDDKEIEKRKRTYLIKLAKEQHPDKDIEIIKNKVLNIDTKELDDYIKDYERHSKK